MTVTKTPSQTRSSSKRRKDVAPLDPVPDTDSPPLDNAVGYVLTKPVNLAQLTDEMNQAADRDDVTLAQLGPDDVDVPVSEDNPAQLWVVPAAVSADVVAQVVAAHVIEANWGVPTVLVDFSAIVSKLLNDPTVTLSTSDKDTLLRGMALQFNAVMTTPPPVSSAPPSAS